MRSGLIKWQRKDKGFVGDIIGCIADGTNGGARVALDKVLDKIGAGKDVWDSKVGLLSCGTVLWQSVVGPTLSLGGVIVPNYIGGPISTMTDLKAEVKVGGEDKTSWDISDSFFKNNLG